MGRLEAFKQDLTAKKAVKIIAGIDNYNIQNIKKVVKAAEKANASAVDISAKPEIITEARNLTNLPLFVSSIVPEELAMAVYLGADAIELGNYEHFYKKGTIFSKEDVLALVTRTLEIINKKVFFSVTIPGLIPISEQIDLAVELEAMGIDLLQTEGGFIENPKAGVRGLIERVELTLANTIELSRNVEMPIMTSTGITPTTAPLAFASGASAIGCGSCINKLNSEISMIATTKQLVEIASRNSDKALALA